LTLQPLLDAAPAIQVHAFAAMAAFALGFVQLAAPKGTLPHRTVGYVWVVLMLVICITSFWIQDLRVWARRHRVPQHRNAMIAMFAGALLIAGLFTFVPGRIMHAVVLGN
jgi:uncharacterized membrane protein